MNKIENKSRVKAADAAVVILSGIWYWLFAYYLKRYDAILLIVGYAMLFAGYLYLIRLSKFSLHQIIILAFIFRFIFLFSEPGLSDDYWRFIWDGNLIKQGINPYVFTPDEVLRLQNFPGQENIYSQLSNCCTHSTYTPITQGIFFSAVWLSEYWGDPVVWMRLVIYVVEAGTAVLLIKNLKLAGFEVKNALWYVLNPLVILEFTANLHHEAFVVFFLGLFVLFLLKGKSSAAAVGLGAAVASKLLPLIFLPIFLSNKKWLTAILLSALVLVIPAITYLPWLDWQSATGFGSGLRLYFEKFEFNPSLWFVVRKIGWLINGFNIIQWAVPVMAACSAVAIVWFALSRKATQAYSLIEWGRSMEVIWAIYLLFSSTVHPWYVAPMVFFAVFSGSRFGILWSGLVFLTYVGYSRTGYEEYPFVLLIEYLSVGIFFWLEQKKWVKKG